MRRFTGGMPDEDVVGNALEGCDAALHTAAPVGVTGRAANLVEVNLDGTRNVVGGAVARGLDPVAGVCQRRPRTMCETLRPTSR